MASPPLTAMLAPTPPFGTVATSAPMVGHTLNRVALRQPEAEEEETSAEETVARQSMGAETEQEAEEETVEAETVSRSPVRSGVVYRNRQIAAATMDASMFTVTGGDIQQTGTVVAHPSAGNKVTVDAPTITLRGTVALAEDVEVPAGTEIFVGPIQNLVSSSRVAVYRRNGATNGEVVAELRSGINTPMRDAMFDVQADGRRTPSAPAPWYYMYASLSQARRQAEVHLTDRPATDWDATYGENGRLTEMRGQDRFITSVSAKMGDRILHLKNTAWEVPWNIAIDSSGAGTGGQATSAPSAAGASVTGGTIAVNAPNTDWYAFPTVEAAMAASNDVLMHSLVPSREDPAAHDIIVQALRRKNPALTFTLFMDETHAYLGGDDVSVRLRGHRTVEAGRFTLRSGGAGYAITNLLTVFDPENITSSTGLQIEATPQGWYLRSATTSTITSHYPFVFARTPLAMGGGSGHRYRIMGGLSL